MRLANLNKLLILSVSVNAIFLMGASGCPAGAPSFDWHPKVYIADSRTQSVVADDGSQIFCQDPKFDQLVAMDKSEIGNAEQAYFDVVNECEKWRGPAGAEIK